jgi:hypothetical protein
MRRLILSLIRLLIERELQRIAAQQPWHRRAAQEAIRQVYYPAMDDQSKA